MYVCRNNRCLGVIKFLRIQLPFYNIIIVYSSLSLSLPLSLHLPLHVIDDISGPEATLPDLLNEVATQTNKWEPIALQLDLSHTDIERIKMEEQGRTVDACFIKVFNKWETKLTPPFTWPVIISALESPSVAEFRLASQLKARHLIASAP